MRRFIFAATVSVAGLLAGNSLAQTVPELRVGATVQGVLDDNDQTGGLEDGDQYRYEDYKVAFRRGQRLEAVLRSDFGAYLPIYAPGEEGPGGRPMATNYAIPRVDAHVSVGFAPPVDGTHTLRVELVAPADGTYTFRVRTLPNVSVTEGSFSLSLAQ